MSLPSLPDVPRERRRTATAIAVGAFGVLCLLALVLGLKGLFAPASSDILTSVPPPQPSTGSSAAAGSSSPSTPAVSRSQTRTAPSDLTAFSSPSGNIRCEISSQGARCDIADHTWTATPKPASCTGAWGDSVQLTAERAGFGCASSALREGKALGYGGLLTRGDFRCASRKDGVTCLNVRTHHAFAVARADYALR